MTLTYRELPNRLGLIQSGHEDIYRIEDSTGMVGVSFWKVEKYVHRRFDDGTFGCTEAIYIPLQLKNNRFGLCVQEVGFSAEKTEKTFPVNKPSDKAVYRYLIDLLVKPYKEKREYCVPVDAKKLRKNLEAALLK